MSIQVGRYLFQYNEGVVEGKVVEVSNKAIKIQWLSGNEVWITKEDFNQKFSIFEKLK